MNTVKGIFSKKSDEWCNLPYSNAKEWVDKAIKETALSKELNKLFVYRDTYVIYVRGGCNE